MTKVAAILVLIIMVGFTRVLRSRQVENEPGGPGTGALASEWGKKGLTTSLILESTQSRSPLQSLVLIAVASAAETSSIQAIEIITLHA